MPAILLLVLLLLTSSNVNAQAKPTWRLHQDHQQLVFVRSASWRAAKGLLQRYERVDETWQPVGTPIPVALGRNGMAWGLGLNPNDQRGPVKREGDGKTPAGVFALGTAFGANDALAKNAHGFPYLSTDASHYCVEDPRSDYYNQLIDSRAVQVDGWQKWSPLARADGLFDLAVTVQHNATDPVKGAGSCVFLHIWRGPAKPTAGCTAMASDELKDVVRWLDPRKQPLLVQLPGPALEEIGVAWELPEPPLDQTP